MFDGVENVKSFDCEYSFQEHRESNVFICLLDRWVDISSLVLSSRVHLVLRQSLPLSLKFCRRSEPELSVADGSASIWPRSSEWVFSLQAFCRQFPGRAMEINHWLKHQIKRRTISHCMCVNMHLCVFVKSVCAFVHAGLHASANMCASVGVWWLTTDPIRLIPLLGLGLGWVHLHGNSALSISPPQNCGTGKRKTETKACKVKRDKRKSGTNTVWRGEWIQRAC